MPETLPVPLPAPPGAAQHATIINIVRRAARAEILPRFRRLARGSVRTKSRPDDLVTEADTAAEAMIARALRLAFPGALVVGEEAVAEDPALLGGIADAPLAFIVDPVDGTWNFAHGLALFGTIVAVTQYGTPVFGLIYDPVGDDWILAGAEGPALYDRPLGTARRLVAAGGKPLKELTGYLPLYLFPPAERPRVAAALPAFARTQNLRCSAHEHRMVAQGHVDFLLTAGLNPWDHAAGAHICAAAGCHVEMLDGGPYTAARHDGHLLVAPDRATWNRLAGIFDFLLD